MNKTISNKAVETVPLNATSESRKTRSAITSQSEFEFEDIVFLDFENYDMHQFMQLAVSKTYLASQPKLLCGLTSNDYFAKALKGEPECAGAASFIKAGGIQKDGSFIFMHALLWNGQSIVSTGIELSGSEICFIGPSIGYCSSFIDGAETTVVSKNVELTLGKVAIKGIKETCEHWDELFSIKSDGVCFNNGHSLDSLDFENNCDGDDVWSRNIGVDGYQEIVDASYYWPFPVKFHRKAWWTIKEPIRIF